VRLDGKAQLANPFMTLRPISEGSVYESWIRYRTSLELAASPAYLLDAYVEIQPWNEVGVRLGQQPTPLSRHEALVGPAQLLLPEWDSVAGYFWTGRDKGIAALGTIGGIFDYTVGAYVGTPLRQFEPIRGNYQFVARLGLEPEGPVDSEAAYAAPLRWAVGLSGATSKANLGVENVNPSTFELEAVSSGQTNRSHELAADFLLQSRCVMGLVEGYLRRIEPAGGGPSYTSAGGFAQVGVLVYRRDVDAVMRGSFIDVNLEAKHDDALALEVGANWYVSAPSVVLKTRYAYGSQMHPTENAGGTSNGAPLLATPGAFHLITAQLGVVF
jgi:hypothetical protein